MRKPTSLLAVTLCSLLAACGDPPSPTSVRARIATDLASVLTEVNGAAKGATLPSTAALSLLGNVVPALGGSSASTSSALMQLTSWLPKHVVTKQNAKLAGDGDAVDPQAAIDFLDTEIFTDANHLGDGIYRVPASVACSATEADRNGTVTTTVDAACASKFDQAQVRVRVEDDGDILKFAVQVDPNHDEPLTVSLAHDAVGLTVDLDNASDAMAALAGIFAETPPNARLSGQVTGTLQILGASHAQATLTIDRDLSIAIADAGESLDGAKATRITSAKAVVFAIELDGVAQRGQVDLGLAATTAQFPSTTDTLTLDVPGLTAHAQFANNTGLAITGIGLGDRTLTVARNGQQVIGIDLNQDDGRTLTAMVATDGTLEVTPKLDLRFAVNHAVLGADAGPYDVTQLVMTGAVQPNGSDGLKVLTGSFSIVTNPETFGVTATAGQCVTNTQVSDANSGMFYDQWMTATCP